ncbi:MAG TPA: M20/M25/M40 family metallo-hydrolase [Steroidobacteraceae bacterium]
MKLAPITAVLGCLVSALQAEPMKLTAEESAATRTLVGDVYAGGRAFEYLEVLSDEFGPRLTGSEQYQRSVQWAAGQLREMGMTQVRLEPVVIKHGWQRGSAQARLLGKTPRTLHVASYGWSPPTPHPALRGPIVFLEDTTDAAIAAARVQGALVLIDRASLTGPVAFRHTTPADWERERLYETLDRRLKNAGATAALVYTKTFNQVLRTSAPTEGGEALALPVASIGREDALLIRRRLAKGPVEIELSLDNLLTGPVTLENVIAELPGRERPAEWVMLGAHLDSWDFATGAQDNGSGVAQVMEAARALAHLPSRPRRSLRFVLWASEEQGENGSKAFVRKHAATMGQVVAYLNTDTGAGRPLGWNLAGRSDLARALAPLASLLERLGGSATSDDLDFDTDVAAFIVAGVPTLNLDVVDDQYDAVVHHKPADTLDKVDIHNLTAGAAMLAVTAYALAETAEPAVPHLSVSQREQLLERTGALEYVRSSSMKDLLQ